MVEIRRPGRNPRQGLTSKALKARPRKPPGRGWPGKGKPPAKAGAKR